MSRVRALDVDHDWLFGKGQNDYKRNLDAVVQNINTRLNSFLGDCFFALADGIDWFNLLGSKDQTSLNLAIAAVILNTLDVTGMIQLSVSLNAARAATVSYEVQTSYSRASVTFQFDLNAAT